jgi:hypothetical protein
VELAQRVVAYNRAGEEDLRSDRIGEDGDGAIGNFREALALDEHNSRARQGLAAAESGLIRRAEDAARARDFASAGTWLAEASKVRDSSPTIADAFERIEQIRAATLLQLRDDGLRDLATPQGLKPAREKLAEALRIALPGDAVVAQLRERIDLATHYGSFRPGRCSATPCAMAGAARRWWWCRMVASRWARAMPSRASDAERPSHYVRFDRGFAMAITEITVSDFERYVKRPMRGRVRPGAAIRWSMTNAAAISSAAAAWTGVPTTMAAARWATRR